MKVDQIEQLDGDGLNIIVRKDHGDPMIFLQFREGSNSLVYAYPNLTSDDMGRSHRVQPCLPVEICLTVEQATTIITKLRWALALSPKPKVVKKPAKKKARRR